MKLSFLTATLCVGLMSACTTVEIASTQPSNSIVPKVSMESTLLKRTAVRLTDFFHTKGWCKVNATGRKQTAAQILLEGLKTGEDTDISVSDYGSSDVSTAVLIDDIKMASTHVQKTTDLARRVLTEDAQLATLREELNILESALISARQAEDTFSQALHVRAMSGVSAYDGYRSSVEDLRAVTDAFGDKLRGSSQATLANNG